MKPIKEVKKALDDWAKKELKCKNWNEAGELGLIEGIPIQFIWDTAIESYKERLSKATGYWKTHEETKMLVKRASTQTANEIFDDLEENGAMYSDGVDDDSGYAFIGELWKKLKKKYLKE
jgi:hypothetical protein